MPWNVSYSLAPGGSNTQLTPGAGSLVAQGVAAALASGKSLAPIAGGLGLVGNSPILNSGMAPGTGSLALAGQLPSIGGGGATLVFDYSGGFSGVTGNWQLVTAAPTFSGSNLYLTQASLSQHQAGCAWYKTAQIDVHLGFQCDFTFTMPATGARPHILGMTFCIQNSTTTTNPTDAFGNHSGIFAGTDANLCGDGAYSTNANPGIGNGLAIKFDVSGSSDNLVNFPASSGKSSSIGLYINGGPFAGLVPQEDLNAFGIDLNAGNLMHASVVYDSTLLLLTIVLTDTVTGNAARLSWPVNIPNILGQNSAWIGFTSGNVQQYDIIVNGVKLWTGFNTRLAAPTFGLTPGLYASTQTVSISGPSGASIYYTLDGTEPTAADTLYTGSLTISSSTIVKAVAIQASFTDSQVASGYYQIASGSPPNINFPTGFSSASGLIIPVGAALLSGSNLTLTDSVVQNEVGAAWFPVPVGITSFITSFTVQINGSSGAGMAFVIQNKPPASLYSAGNTRQWGAGGPYCTSNNQNGCGYSGSTGTNGENAGFLESWCFKVDAANNQVGVFTGGASTSGGTSIGGSPSTINLSSNHPITVQLSYSGTTLSVTLTDNTSGSTWSTSFTGVNIASAVGGSTAYVGFTACTFFSTVVQEVTKWTM
jgi:hypothetical protein